MKCFHSFLGNCLNFYLNEICVEIFKIFLPPVNFRWKWIRSFQKMQHFKNNVFLLSFVLTRRKFRIREKFLTSGFWGIYPFLKILTIICLFYKMSISKSFCLTKYLLSLYPKKYYSEFNKTLHSFFLDINCC